MKAILSVILILGCSAHAVLGGRTSEIDKDLPQLAHRQSATHSDPSNCYTVKEISGDGVGVKEYINKDTDTVFMVRSTSRVAMAIKPLMTAEDFAEYHQANQSGTRSVHNLTRNHKNVESETVRLKVSVTDRQTIHRSVLILKPSVPKCVPSPEALP